MCRQDKRLLLCMQHPSFESRLCRDVTIGNNIQLIIDMTTISISLYHKPLIHVTSELKKQSIGDADRKSIEVYITVVPFITQLMKSL